MPENKLPHSINRPRLLSDILEIPLSESAVPEEYTMQRPSSSPVPPPAANKHGAQNGFQQRHFGPYQQPRLLSDSSLDSTTDPGVIGQLPKRLSSSSLLSHTYRLQPLTPINPQIANLYNENRWPSSNPPPTFTTSPAVSESGSPSPSRFPSIERTSSQTSLNTRHFQSRPRTPTPSSAGLKGKARSQPRSSSAPSSPKSRRSTPHPHGKPSVKHLTCFWWKVKGDCRFTEEDCLYAHHDTGLLADAPRQVTPGEPAKAGRHLERALENLRAKRNPSSSSLNTSMVANPSTPESQGTSSHNSTPIDREVLQERIASLQSDNHFLRNLVEQSGKEKSILMSTIEGLQKENSNLNQDVEFLKDVVNGLQQQHRHLSGGMTSPSSTSLEPKEDMQQEKTGGN